MIEFSSLVRATAFLWRKKYRRLAIVVLLFGCIGVAIWWRDEIRIYAGRAGLWVAEKTGILPSDDPLAVLNERIARAKARVKDARSPQDREGYEQQVTILEEERRQLLASLTEKAKAAKQARPSLSTTYAALERRPQTSGVAFRVTAIGDHQFSIDWQFTSYVIRSKDAEKLGNPVVRESMTASDIYNAGRAFYLGGVVLARHETGLFVPAGLSIQLFRSKSPDWVAAKVVLATQDVFVGTIFTGVAPNPVEEVLAMMGLNLSLFPLSLEDQSFSSVRVRELTEHGLISVKGMLGAVFNPLLITKFDPLGIDDLTIGGKKFTEYEVIALRALGPRAITQIGTATKK